MGEAEQIDQADVYVLDIEQRMCDADGCELSATKYVGLDIRDIGRSVRVGDYCKPHAEQIAARVRLALPPEAKG